MAAAAMGLTAKTLGTDDIVAARSKSKKLMAGAASGIVSALAFQPLDVLRTHQQGAFLSQAAATAGHTVATGTTASVDAALWPRVRSMWRGTTTTLLRVAGGAGLYFATLDHWLHVMPPSAINTFVAGAAARTFAGAVMSPLTVIKARMEWQPPGVYQTNMQVARQVLQQEGVLGLYRGMVPTLVRDVPFSGLYVLIYTRMKAGLEAELPDAPRYVLHFGSGMVSGVIATTLVHPADVIKTRMQLAIQRTNTHGELVSERNSLSLRETVRKMLHEEGVGGFKRGIVPRVLKRTLSTAVTWTIYENLSIR